jgi:hypothetical protein
MHALCAGADGQIGGPAAHSACMILTELPGPSRAVPQTKIVQALRTVLEIGRLLKPYTSPAGS